VSSSAGFRNILASLKHRDYAVYTYSHMPGLIFMWAQRIAVGWLAWELTQSPSWLGLIAMADLLPAVFLAPFAGALADRVNVIKLLLASEIVLVVYSAVLWLLIITGLIDIWLLFFFSILLGCNHPFGNTGRANVVPLIVPHADLAPAIALNAICFNTARTAGPMVAGLVIANSNSTEWIFALFGIGEVIMVIGILMFRTKTQPRKGTGGGLTGMARDVTEGVGYVWRHPGIGPALFLLAFASITTRPSIELLPGFADEVFARGAEGLGWLGAAVGGGGILGSVWLAWRGGIVGLANIVVMHTLLMASGLTLFAVVGNFWLALVFLTLVGFSFNVSGVGSQTLVQYSVDPVMRGRVMSIFMLIFRGMPALGALLIGIAAEFFGLQLAVAVAGAICAAGCVWAYRRRGAMTEHLEKPGTTSVSATS
jgi:MFS family permease